MTSYVAAAALLERLLTDARFRAAFRADPARACREHGLERLAAQFEGVDDLDGPVALEPRENSSALAGVLLGVALEGVAALDFLGELPPPGQLARALERALEADPKAIPAIQLR